MHCPINTNCKSINFPLGQPPAHESRLQDLVLGLELQLIPSALPGVLPTHAAKMPQPGSLAGGDACTRLAALQFLNDFVRVQETSP